MEFLFFLLLLSLLSRPLTKEMKSYGRSDTHYLPYIYQCMQNQLLARDDQYVQPLRVFLLVVFLASWNTVTSRSCHRLRDRMAAFYFIFGRSFGSRQCEYLLVRLLLRVLLQDGNVQSELHNACGARHPHWSMRLKHLKCNKTGHCMMLLVLLQSAATPKLARSRVSCSVAQKQHD